MTTASPVAFRAPHRRPLRPPEIRPQPPPPPQVALSPADRAVIAAAEHALLDERRLLTADELAALAALPDGAVMALASLAHQVRLAWCGPEVEIEGILSAKTGGCPEDCHFCSQSSRFDTPGQGHPLPRHRRGPDRRPRDGRRSAPRSSASCSPSGAPTSAPCERILDLVPRIHDETGLNVAVSAGILTEDQARRLAEGGVHRYNHNVETARSYFPSVVTTHTLGRAGRDLPPGQGARHGAVLWRPDQHGRDRRPAGRAADPAPGARADRGAAQLPQPAPRHPARRPTRSSAPGKPSAGSRSSAWRCPR